MYRLSHIVVSIETKKFIENFYDIENVSALCRQCDNYGKIWSCPPFERDTNRMLLQFKRGYIIGTKIMLCSEQNINETIKEVRMIIDSKLLDMEAIYHGSRSFFAGSCILCSPEQCRRNRNAPCIYPNRQRPSLESMGFNVVKASSELLGIEILWGEKDLSQRYITLISGLFL